MTKILSSSDECLQKAARILLDGGVVAIPTDTVYGFAALVTNEEAVARLYKIKERNPIKSIAVLLSDAEQAPMVAGHFSSFAQRITEVYWPGALTVIVDKKAGLPGNLTSNNTVGIRVPDHDFARELMRLTGPLATTSANHSGEPPAKKVSDFADSLGDQLDLIIDDGPVMGGVPSTVINCSVEEPVVLREGAIPGAELLKYRSA